MINLRQAIRLSLGLVSLLLIAASIAVTVNVQTVKAAGQKCYMESLFGAGLLECNSTTLANAYEQNGRTIASLNMTPENCYTFKFIEQNVTVTPGQCTQPPFVEAAVSATPAGCFQGVKVDGKAVYTKVACTEAYRLGLGKPFENGKCYLVDMSDSSNPYKDFTDCATAEKLAAENNTPPGGTTTPGPVKVTNADREKIRDCGTPDNCIKTNPLIQKVADFIDFLSAVVGVAVIGSIIVGGIQYSASRGDPQAVAKAKGRIINAVIAFVAYMFLYSFIQWLIPGGVF